MVKKSKLFYALDKETGRDYDAEKRKKLVKAALKKKEEKKARKAAASGGEGEGEVCLIGVYAIGLVRSC